MKLRLFIVVIVVSILQIGCRSSSAPKCTDPQVQIMAIENALKTITKNESKIELMVYLKNDPDAIAEFEKLNRQAKKFGYSGYFGDLATFSNLFTNYNIDDELKAFVDSVFDAGIIYLDGIRVNGTDRELKKCDCGAAINLGDYLKYEISYTAQYTEDDQIYVTTTVDSDGEKE